ncbi:hypothetical protein MXB_2386 [Myxobolus squamalis]|nr:hypothetical protein MXB_2386 [Myxobolus squamalis]
MASLLLFWVDIIPGFGYSDTIAESWSNFIKTISCTFGKGNCQSETSGFAFGYLISIITSHIFGLNLIKHSEGSLFWALNSNLVTPCAVIFWILFTADPLRWNPHFKKSDWFSVVATIVILPTLVYYSLK